MNPNDLQALIASGEGQFLEFKRMNELCDKQNCPRPEIQADADWFRMIFHRQTGDLRGATAQVTGEVAGEVSEQVGEQVRSMLLACSDDPKSKADMLKAAGLAPAYLNYKRHLQRLLAADLVERAIPEKPTSRLQKYRLTQKGRDTLRRENTEAGQ